MMEPEPAMVTDEGRPETEPEYPLMDDFLGDMPDPLGVAGNFGDDAAEDCQDPGIDGALAPDNVMEGPVRPALQEPRTAPAKAENMEEDVEPELPPVEESQARAKLFSYLIDLTGQLPGEKVREAEEQHLQDRLVRIRDRLSVSPDDLDRPMTVAGLKRRGEALRKRMGLSGASESQMPVPAAGDFFLSTFKMLGNVGSLLPPDQKLDLRNRMQRIMGIMEKYR